ncbi:MAG: hypothetical protein IJ496_05155 [Ruminococcus sp.]|nr:hypothetical protein [Ruminococcus sp.]
MKKYLKLIPLMLYPYAYLIGMVGLYIADEVLSLFSVSVIPEYLFWGVIILYNVYVLFIAVFNAVLTAGKRYTAYDGAKINLIVKGVQIPAYILHFLMGLAGLIMSVWGIGFIVIAVLVDLLTILLTGISAVGCSIKMKKEGLLPLSGAILTGIGSFIYCADIAAAIVFLVLGRKQQRERKAVEEERNG